MANEITGKIHLIRETQSVGSSNFQKREFVIETDEQYPQYIALELQQDRVDLIDPYAIGETVKVSINFRGRAWTNPQGEEKYFNTIVAWKFERVNVATPPTFAPHTPPSNYTQQPTDINEEEADDLPF